MENLMQKKQSVCSQVICRLYYSSATFPPPNTWNMNETEMTWNHWRRSAQQGSLTWRGALMPLCNLYLMFSNVLNSFKWIKIFLDKTAKPVNLVVKQCVCNKQGDRRYVLCKKKLNGEFRQLKLTSKKLGDNLFATVLSIITRHANRGSNCIYTLHIVGEEQEDTSICAQGLIFCNIFTLAFLSHVQLWQPASFLCPLCYHHNQMHFFSLAVKTF